MQTHQSARRSDSRHTGGMVQTDLSMRPADSADLTVINSIVSGAIETWGLAKRAHRLAQQSLTYTTFDLDYMFAVLGENESGVEIAVALWEPEKDESNNHSSIFLHGVYVLPEHQRCGIGARMVAHVMSIAKEDRLDGITVKAWRDSEEFFLKLGFCPPPDNGRDHLYPRRLRKSV